MSGSCLFLIHGLTGLLISTDRRSVSPRSSNLWTSPGWSGGAGGGEGLGNQFLSHIRDVDAIAHVVRCFDDPNIVHVDGSIDPRRDIEVVEAELIFKDLETVERKLSEAGKRAKSGEKKSRAEAEFHARVRDHLMGGRLVRYFSVRSAEEGLWLRDCHLLTNKPVMYVCNVNEKDVAEGNDYVRSVRDVAANEGARVVSISAAVEAEVAELGEGERAGIPRRTGAEGIRAHKGHTRRVRSS
jgi:ribosome-binding ATPase YchF (GTP1/OBG family)